MTSALAKLPFSLPMWKRVARRVRRRTECLDLWDKEFLAQVVDQQTISPAQAHQLNELAVWVAEYDAMSGSLSSRRDGA